MGVVSGFEDDAVDVVAAQQGGEEQARGSAADGADGGACWSSGSPVPSR
ncbi:hypothetical protein STTU_6421 [Streptomyces sp. Tu6071]|nr:hypothetical protein STTU_6421 [Streptomyces sp. Tu6071]